jgi:hypothetical protein
MCNKNLPWFFRIIVFGFCMFGCGEVACLAQGEARALFEGVKLARNSLTHGKANVKCINRLKSSDTPILRDFEWLDDSILCMSKRGGYVSELVVLKPKQDQVLRYDGKSLVEMNTLQGARGEWGLKLFDPRTLGIAELINHQWKVDDCVWKDGDTIPTVLGDEQIDGQTVRFVSMNRGKSVFSYWISALNFQVLRFRMALDDLEVQVESKYKNADSVLPNLVRVVRRTKEGTVRDLEYVVLEADFDTPIVEDRFNFQSFGLRNNAMLVDYSSDRMLGMWNGSEFKNEPAAPDRHLSISTSNAFITWRSVLVGANIFIIFTFLLLGALRRMKTL